MIKLGLFTLAAQSAPRLFQVRRRTWLLLAGGLLALSGLMIWVAIALLGWLVGQVQGWSTAAPQAANEAISSVARQLEQAVPGAREKITEYLPILKPEDRPRRDVSGTDFAPVPRYPGLARSYWHRESRLVTVRYEGQADYAAVLDHYVQGFISLGYRQDLQSAAPDAETHAWTQGNKRYLARIAGKPKGVVAVEIETTLD